VGAMSLESYLYEEKIDKLIGLLKKVLYGLAMGWSVSSPEGDKLYAEAADYLKGLEDE
jgi:hypothetical protein